MIDLMKPDRVRAKICGITCLEDALLACRLGADALGFIFVPSTPRYVTCSAAEEILRSLPPFVFRVAVCAHTGQACCLDLFHAVQTYALPKEPLPDGVQLILAARVHGPESLDALENQLQAADVQPDAILLDAWHAEKLGGTGEAFDWALASAAKIRLQLPVILAGGLTAENVGLAIQTVAPWAVDVGSGVESEPGRKDPEKLKSYLRAVHAAAAGTALESRERRG